MSKPNSQSTDASVDHVVTCGKKPFGTIHWAGIYKGFPAIMLSWYGGVDLFYFDHEWKNIRFTSLADCRKWLGITT